MKKLLLCLTLLMLVLCPILLGGQEISKAIKLDKSIPLPPNAEVLKNPDSDASQLKILLDQGKLREFYLKAKPLFTIMDSVKDEDFTEGSFLDRLWVYYYYAAAPTLPTSDDGDLEWVGVRNNIDMSVKDSLGGFVGRHNLPKLVKLGCLRKQELSHLLASYYAASMRALYDNYDPWWKEKRKLIEEKKSVSMPYEEEILWNNRILGLDSRNTTAGNRLRFNEKSFINFLMKCFPGKAIPIRKYITMAGYRDDEIKELIALTVGKNAKTEFLLKGISDRNRKKADENRQQAVPRDIAL